MNDLLVRSTCQGCELYQKALAVLRCQEIQSQRWKLPVLNVQLHPSVLDVILEQKAIQKKDLPLPLLPPPHHPNEAKAD